MTLDRRSAARLGLVLLTTLALVAHLRMLPGAGGAEWASWSHATIADSPMSEGPVIMVTTAGGDVAADDRHATGAGHRHGPFAMLVTCIAVLAALALGLCLSRSRQVMSVVAPVVARDHRVPVVGSSDDAPGRDPPGLMSLRTVVLVR